jgi:hypothetical protein
MSTSTWRFWPRMRISAATFCSGYLLYRLLGSAAGSWPGSGLGHRSSRLGWRLGLGDGLALGRVLRAALSKRSCVDLAATGSAITFSHETLQLYLLGRRSLGNPSRTVHNARMFRKKERPDKSLSGRISTRPPLVRTLRASGRVGSCFSYRRITSLQSNRIGCLATSMPKRPVPLIYPLPGQPINRSRHG